MCAQHGELVLSDVHIKSAQCHPGRNKPEVDTTVASRFNFSFPPTVHRLEEEARGGREHYLDDDGDIVFRSRQEGSNERMTEVITVEHSMATELGSVGLQLWMASFLLCDFILANAPLFRDEYILELGAGTGFCSILLATVKPAGIICTDKGQAVLTQCSRNISRNGHLMGNVTAQVRELDWTNDHPKVQHHSTFCWQDEDHSLLQRVRYIIAADVIYDDRLTDAFFQTLRRLMRENGIKSAFIALEKRLNFTLEELSVCSPAHEHFMKWIDALRVEDGFDCQQVEASFPQCFQYARTKEMELWQVSYSGSGS